MCGMMMIEIEIGRGNLLMKLATSLLYFSFEERFSKIDQMSGLYHKTSVRIKMSYRGGMVVISVNPPC